MILQERQTMGSGIRANCSQPTPNQGEDTYPAPKSELFNSVVWATKLSTKRNQE